MGRLGVPVQSIKRRGSIAVASERSDSWAMATGSTDHARGWVALWAA